MNRKLRITKIMMLIFLFSIVVGVVSRLILGHFEIWATINIVASSVLFIGAAVYLLFSKKQK